MGGREPLARTVYVHNAWMALFVSVVAVVAIFAQTAGTAIAQWENSSAYSYAFLVAPISAFLIWRDRAAFVGTTPRPWAPGLIMVAAFAGLWLLADMLSLNEGRHIAFMGMIQGTVLAVIGLGLYRALAFPLLYLWLMVPTGTVLVTPLQHLSHAGSLTLIRLSGIPVFADGMLIEVPEGRFFVAPGCAGLNFILTALALSLLYGKLNYRSAAARLRCVAIALGAAVVSNIVRIYLIIVLTQLTHRKLDIAEDHLLYGWGFFGVIMLAMMWWGGRFADADIPLHAVPRSSPAPVRAAAVAAAAALIAATPAALSRVVPHTEDSGIARFLHGLAPASSSSPQAE